MRRNKIFPAKMAKSKKSLTLPKKSAMLKFPSKSPKLPNGKPVAVTGPPVDIESQKAAAIPDAVPFGTTFDPPAERTLPMSNIETSTAVLPPAIDQATGITKVVLPERRAVKFPIRLIPTTFVDCVSNDARQGARVSLPGFSHTRVQEITASIVENGYDETKGPRPETYCLTFTAEQLKAAKVEEIFKDLAKHMLIGNSRIAALAFASQQRKDLERESITIWVYPSLTKEQASEITLQEARSTKPFTKYDLLKQGRDYILGVHARGGLTEAGKKFDELDWFRAMGLNRVLEHFQGSIKEQFLVKGPLGIRLKDRMDDGTPVTSSLVFKPGNGGNRTETVQYCKALARMPLWLSDKILEDAAADPQKHLNFKAINPIANAWTNAINQKKDEPGNGDLDLRPDLADVKSLKDLAEKFPESKLIQAVQEVENVRAEKMSGSTGGGKTDVGMMQKQDLINVINTSNQKKRTVAVQFFNQVLRGPGDRGESARVRQEKFADLVQQCCDGSVTGDALKDAQIQVLKLIEEGRSERAKAVAANVENAKKG